MTTKYTLLGQSTSGIGTGLVVPELKVALDMGVMIPEAVKCPVVCVTHAHTDHVGALMSYLATRDMVHMPTPTVLVPPSMVEPLTRVLDAWRALDSMAPLSVNLVGLAVGEDFPLTKMMVVRPFRTVHRGGPSQGYAFISVKQKLLPEFVGQDIKALLDAGVMVTERTGTIEVAYTGDTTTEMYALNPQLRSAEMLVAECTFTESDVTVEEARRRGHTHLDELKANPDLTPQAEVVLVHFSQRQDPEEIRVAFNMTPFGDRIRPHVGYQHA